MTQNIYKRDPVSGNKPTSAVLLLHGLGSNGQDLIALAPYWAKYLPDTVFISPDAPFVCDMVPPGYPNAYQWFSLQNRAPDKIEAGIKTALPHLKTLMDRVLDEYSLSADKLALVGFSQGTMMSLYAAPRYKDCTAGVLGYSGALFGADDLPEKAHKPPIHLIHGEADDVVPVAAYHDALEKLTQKGFTVTGHTTPGLPHSIDEHGIKSGGKFLAGILK
jgi:phospholipase/carboxylesterase